uniref:Piwi domain-containing protein n=1 Tax=Panagrolaimus sp. ES5 TaxID=591445 RepID=A0AC34GT40_9BILA
MDRQSYSGNSRGFASSDRSYDRTSSYSRSDRRSSNYHHPYEQKNSNNDRRSGFDGNRGRRSDGSYDPGTGRARDDDSRTEALPSLESTIVPLTQLDHYPMLFKNQMTAQVNGYEISTKNAKIVYQYDIQWEGVTKKDEKVDLNTQNLAAYRLKLKNAALLTIFDQLLHNHKNFFGDGIVYDTGSIFFAHKILLEKGETRKFDINIDEFAQEAKDYYKAIQSAAAFVSLSAEIHIDSLNGELSNDRPIIQYLELAFSQLQRKSGDYYCYGNEVFEKESAQKLEGTPCVLKSGCVKSIRLIGEPVDKKLLINLIPKKTAFYGTESLTELIEHTIRSRVTDIWNRNNLQLANDAVKNLVVRTKHLENNLIFCASGLANISAKQQTFEINGEMVTVADYFYQKHQRKLLFPDLPCVVEKKKYFSNYYPLEVLEIAGVQKIPKAKQNQNKSLLSLITRNCCFDPASSIEAIDDQFYKAEIRMSNDYIKNTGCRVDARHLLCVKAQQLYPPCIVFKDTQKTLNSGLFGMQVGDKFYQPACIQKLACVVVPSRNLDVGKAKYFVNEFLRRLELYGVQIKQYEFLQWTDVGGIYERLQDLEKDGYDYVFAIGEDDELHHGLKLMELKTPLVTQHVMPNTLNRANNTLYDNLAFKFNSKAGGINWTFASDPVFTQNYGNVDLLKSLMKNTMFFGIDLSHPCGTNEPSCVGFASNLNSISTSMSKGDFGYQSPRETLVAEGLLSSKFTEAIKAYYRNSGQYPRWIVVYRAGLSEGEIQKIQTKEIPVLKSAIEMLQKENAEFHRIAVKLTFVMSNEKSNFRLYKEDINSSEKAPAQNLPPGTCVSEVLVSPNRIPSFILISQRPLNGTAKPVVYYVLEGADVVPFPHLEWLTYCLCYSNTTVSPMSICSPIDSASDLSKRARNNLKQYEAQKADRDGADDIFWSEDDVENDEKGDDYLKMLNQKLKAGIFEDRFTA